MTGLLRHPLFAPVLAGAALGWGTLVLLFLLAGPQMGGWAQTVLRACFGWSGARTYRLDAVILATLETPLVLGVIGLFYADELRAFLRRVRGRVLGAGAVAAYGAAAVALVLTGELTAGAAAPALPVPLREDRPAPRATLIDHHGRAFDPAAGGRPVALTFVYTNCHQTCPALVATLDGVARRVGERAAFVAITLDPARDTPAVLREYAARWSLGPTWALAGGAPDTLTTLREAYGVRAIRQPDGEIGHDNVIVLLDRRGRVAYTWRGLGHRVDDIAAALERLATES